MKPYSIKQILPLLDHEHTILNFAENCVFDNAKPVNEANEHSIVWVSTNNKNKLDLILSTPAPIIISDLSTSADTGLAVPGKCLILVKDPRLVFLRIIRYFFEKKVEWGVHPSAIIDKDAVVHTESYIGPRCYIGQARIGRGAIIHGNCFIYDNVLIGENVTVHAGTVIGSEGFGYQRNTKNEFEKFPHIGGVVIENNVDIGANTCIDRGTLGNTYIKEGAKIDNLVHIAHNVVIGKHTAIIAHAMIGGSTVIEDYAWVAPSAALRDGLTVGESAVVGLGAIVTKSVPGGETWAGNPARLLNK